jgi:hypothetical protein
MTGLAHSVRLRSPQMLTHDLARISVQRLALLTALRAARMACRAVCQRGGCGRRLGRRCCDSGAGSRRVLDGPPVGSFEQALRRRARRTRCCGGLRLIRACGWKIGRARRSVLDTRELYSICHAGGRRPHEFRGRCLQVCDDPTAGDSVQSAWHRGG